MNRLFVFLLASTLLALAACSPSAQLTVQPRPRALVGPSDSGPTPTATATATLLAASNPRPQSTATLPASSPTAGPSLPERAPTNSAQAVQNIAKMVYDALDAHQDLQPYVEGVMTAFGVPPLGNEDLDLATTRLKQGSPLLFKPQLADIAGAFSDGGLITLDSFIAAANARGARQRDTHQPLTREYLSRKFMASTSASQYQKGQVIPAFILALSQERARRIAPKNLDPVWGDGLLDPLQVTLLLYSVSFAGSNPRPAPMAQISGAVELNIMRPSRRDVLPAARIPSPGWLDEWIEFVTDQMEDKATDGVQEMVEIPLDKVEAARVSVCASLLLYGHKLTVKASPNLLYHNDGNKPAATRADAYLEFQDDYWDNYFQIDRWVLETLGDCKLPRKGPVIGKPLDWSVSDGLREHGKFDMAPSLTNDNGKAMATWRTVPETTPESQRTFQNQRDAVGAIIVRTTDLVPGWGTLERVVELMKDAGNAGDAPLTVIYYKTQQYRVDTPWFGSAIKLSGSICAWDKPFTLRLEGNKPGAGPYTGKVEFTPKDATSGSWMATGSFSTAFVGTTKDSGGSTYQVTGLAEGKPVLKLGEVTQNGVSPMWSGSFDWPGQDIPLSPDTGMCSSQ